MNYGNWKVSLLQNFAVALATHNLIKDSLFGKNRRHTIPTSNVQQPEKKTKTMQQLIMQILNKRGTHKFHVLLPVLTLHGVQITVNHTENIIKLTLIYNERDVAGIVFMLKFCVHMFLYVLIFPLKLCSETIMLQPIKQNFKIPS